MKQKSDGAHIHFDGLSDVFCALDMEAVAANVQTHQHLLRGCLDQQLNQKSDPVQMVSIELLHTHIHFDRLCNMFGTLGLEVILGEVEGRQCPLDGGVIIGIHKQHSSRTRSQIELKMIATEANSHSHSL